MTCERFEFPGGLAGTICMRGRRTKPVPPCACGNTATHACDYPLGGRRTCSKSLCAQCRVQMDKGKDFCSEHAEMGRGDKRICTKCRLEKPITDYHRDAAKSDGLSIWCKVCKRADRLRREPPKPGISEAERFWLKVAKSNEESCWLWTGRTNNKRRGYGVFNGRHAPIWAHRMAYELANGPIPPGLSVLHRCDNPPCCNPRHLFLGTHADNMADKVSKGRQTRGEAMFSTKLKPYEVAIIKRLLLDKNITQREIASQFDVLQSTISDIATGVTWREIQAAGETAAKRESEQRAQGSLF